MSEVVRNRHTPPAPLDRRHREDSQDALRDLPQSLLLPFSLKPATPGRQVLLRHQHVLLARGMSAAPPPSQKKTTTELSAHTNSIIVWKAKHCKDKWLDFKKRVSPRSFRFAGYVFLALVIIALGTVIVGWYGLSKDTISHEVEVDSPSSVPMTQPTPADAVDNDSSLWSTQAKKAFSRSTVLMQMREDPKHSSTTVTDPPTPNPSLTSSVDEVPEITIVHTIVMTITSVVTDTALKTLTTTVFISICTTCLTTPEMSPSTTTQASSTATNNNIMTGTMYCPCPSRPNIYTLCPLVHSNQPGMFDATAVPGMASSAMLGTKNPFTTVRLAFASLWNSVPSLGGLLRADDKDKCDCAGMKTKLDQVMDLVGVQQQLIDSQHKMISGHRKSLAFALQVLRNVTASKGNSISGESRG
ncbi:hypothetical protein F5Y19DRAFT_489585 [Xylariaceae sp. FL1651]|nr:hypothetical protein F5Y19DRAFT_489585 [Xylariaceae sp. FL1651]